MEPNKTTSLLSAAGFRMHTPQNAKQKELYAAFPSNKLERGAVKGKVFYVFKDEKAGVEYVGGKSEYRRYQQLCVERHVAPAPEEQMNDSLQRELGQAIGPRSTAVTAPIFLKRRSARLYHRCAPLPGGGKYLRHGCRLLNQFGTGIHWTQHPILKGDSRTPKENRQLTEQGERGARDNPFTNSDNTLRAH